MPGQLTKLSIVVPLFNEEENLSQLIRALKNTKANLSQVTAHFILVDDGSTDNTFELAAQVALNDSDFTTVKLTRNFGSHAAIAAGLSISDGDCAAFIAADGQDPPELLATMLERWRDGYKLVWAARTEVQGQSAAERFFPNLYYRLFNFAVAFPIPDLGVDFALMDRTVVDILKDKAQLTEPIFAQITDTGFPSTVVFYSKPPRTAGKSGWTMRKKLDMAYITLTYSLRPFRWCCWAGLATLSIMAPAAVICAAMSLKGWLLALTLLLIIGIFLGLAALVVALMLLGEYAGIKLRALQGGNQRFCIEKITRYEGADLALA